MFNGLNPWFDTEGGNNTLDMIFLLSLEEVVKYFGDSGQLRNRPKYKDYLSDQYSNARIAQDIAGSASWWWLRSPGFGPLYVISVDDTGDLLVGGDDVFCSGGVRPALWLNLGS